MVRKSIIAATAGVAMVFASTAAFASYTQIVVIGDSFSDTGNAHIAIPGSSPTPPYYLNRFSNGPNYIDTLAAAFGVSPTASLNGGTNYAYASSTTSSTQPSPVNPRIVPSLQAQLATYLASVGGVANPNALYIVEGGTNDLFGGLIALNGTNGSTATASLSAVAAAGASNIAGIEAQLVAAGAKNLLTVNIPDLSLLPVVRQKLLSGLANERDLAKAAALEFNADVLADLGPTPAGVRRSYLDLNKLTDAFEANPAAYGFTDTSTACFAGNGLAPAATTCAPSEFNNHVFFDIVHFSGRSNDAFAQAALVAVPEPGSMLIVAGAVGALLLRRRMAA